MVAMAGCAAANPIVGPDARSVADGVYGLFLANLPLDMLLFSAVFLVIIWKLKSPLWADPKTSSVLVAEVVVAGAAVAVAGAFIDFYAFFSEFAELPNGYYADVTWGNAALAAAGVFASVYAISLAVARLRLIPSLIPAAALTAVNLLAWAVSDEGKLVESADGVVILAGFLFLLIPPVMFGIARIHRNKGALS